MRSKGPGDKEQKLHKRGKNAKWRKGKVEGDPRGLRISTGIDYRPSRRQGP